MKRIAYKGWKNCWQLGNGIVDLVITGDVGPRVIRFGFVGGDNEFKEYDEHVGKRGGSTWRIYGGHRLWHAPESSPRSYFPDNSPVTVQEQSGVVRVQQRTEKTTGIQKEIDFRLSAKSAHVKVTHRLWNHGHWPVELAPWALSVMAPGGKAIVPLPPRGSHPRDLAPTSSLTLWSYTDLADPRWTLGKKYILLRQDPAAKDPQKIGASVPDGWAAYARHGRLFVKRFPHNPRAAYADFGCNFEAFTNKDMLEVESLGPLTHLAPGALVEHVEHWYLFRDVPTPLSDADVVKSIEPKISATQRLRS